MPDFECPSCGGGFPATADGDGCPWCGEAMDGDSAGLSDPFTLGSDPGLFGSQRDLAKREFERDIGSDTHPFIDPDPLGSTSIHLPDTAADDVVRPNRGGRL